MIRRHKNKWLVNLTGLAFCVFFAVGLWFFVKAKWRDERYSRAAAMVGGNAAKGLAAVDRYGCAACHVIPGVKPGTASAGPPLTNIGERSAIAGIAENKPENLIRWIVDPVAMDPQTAMPNLGVTPEDARDIATYLYAAE